MRSGKLTDQAGTPQPSTYDGDFWLWAEHQPSTYPKHTERGGKWMVFVPVNQVDSMWATIKQAVEEGRLGSQAKVATARRNPNALNDRERVICVYTYDGYDEADAMRVRDELRQLGITWPISYKLDMDTLAGNYSNRGAKKRVSLYRV